MKNLFLIAVCIALVMSIGFVYAENQRGSRPNKNDVHSIQIPVIPIELKPGPGQDKASPFCNICHSLDYITMQPPFLRATWTAEVNKMIKVMGAPINEDGAKAITNYLATEYGTGN